MDQQKRSQEWVEKLRKMEVESEKKLRDTVTEIQAEHEKELERSRNEKQVLEREINGRLKETIQNHSKELEIVEKRNEINVSLECLFLINCLGPITV